MATKAPHDESRFVTALFRNAGPIAIALTAAGAVGVAGGLIGALKDWGIPQDRVREYEASGRDGGFLLGVKARSAEDAQRLGQQWRAKGGALS